MFLILSILFLAMPFQYHNHTADVLIEATGNDLEEAFSECAKGMFNLLTNIKKVKAEKKIAFRIYAKTKETLLFDFLEELIFRMDTDFMIFSKFDIKIINGNELECIAYGDKASSYETHGDIKAPTYNEMSIVEGKKEVKIKFVVDI